MRHRLAAALSTLSLTLGTVVLLGVTTAPAATAATAVVPVPTSAAGLGRIVGSPDGNVWFVEEDANKVGRISPTGQVTEFPLPASSEYSQTEDLDVAGDGSVWVVYDSGRRLRHLSAGGVQLSDQSLGAYPYGKQVRVAPAGYVVVSMSYDQSYVALATDTQVVRYANSPECTDAVARAADGAMWCRTSSGLTRLNLVPGGGGVTYPANDYAAYPYAIAAGPTGSIWFGRYFGGTIFTSPDDGEVGYLDAATGQVTAYDTGSRTAPNSLVQGPDGAMWFTSIGAAKGIGHIRPDGTGGTLTQVGGYAPSSLTFGRDGLVYAADATNNVVLKVPTSDLQVTSVDPGEGSVLTGGAGGGLKVKVGKKPVVAKKGVVALRAACAKDAGSPCVGKARLATTAKRAKALSGTATVRVKPGKKATIRLRLTAKGLKAVKTGRTTRLQLQLFAQGSKQPYATQVVKVRR